MKKRVIYIGIIFIFLFLFSPLVRSSNDCENISLNYDFSNLDDYSVMNVFQEREVGETFSTIKLFIEFGNFSFYTNTSLIYLEWNFVNENISIFDLNLNINENNSFIPYLTDPLSLWVKPFDKVLISYKTDNGLGVIRDKFWYPYDEYTYHIWSGAIRDIPRTEGVSIFFPEAFSVKTVPSSGAPVVYPKELIKETRNGTTNQVISQELWAKVTIITTQINTDQLTKCQLYNLEGKTFCISRPLFVSPRNLIEKYNIYNFTEEDLNGKTENAKTGYYLSLTLARTEIVIYLFWISLFFISSSFIYFWFFFTRPEKLTKKDRLFLVYQSTFTIWAFQEGIMALTSISRPLNVTIFDLTLFLPIILLFLIYFFQFIIKNIIKLIKFFSKQLKKPKKT